MGPTKISTHSTMSRHRGNAGMLRLLLTNPRPVGDWTAKDWTCATRSAREAYQGRPFAFVPADAELLDGTKLLALRFTKSEVPTALSNVANARGKAAVLLLRDLEGDGCRLLLPHEPALAGERLLAALASVFGFNQCWLGEQIAANRAKPFHGAVHLRDKPPVDQIMFDSWQFREAARLTDAHVPRGRDLQRLLSRSWEAGGQHFRNSVLR